MTGLVRLSVSAASASIAVLLSTLSVPHAMARPHPNAPELSVRNMLGVAVRRPDDADLAAISDAGLRIVRLDLSWSATERAKGQYDFSAYMPAANRMRTLGIKPIYVLAYGNALYAPLVPTVRYRDRKLLPAAPTDRASIDAFSRWALAAAQALAPAAPAFEVWNEPDVDHWWPPRASARDYGVLARDVCARLHAADPHLEVIGPGVAEAVSANGAASAYMKDLARQNVLGCLDAISTHNYDLTGNTTRDGRYLQTTKAMLRGRILRNKPLWSTEWGWSALDGNVAYQATYLVKTFLIALANGVRLNIWYQWKDWHSTADEKLNHYGLIASTGAPKPAYFALRQILRSVGDAHLTCTVAPSGDAFAAIFTAPDGGKTLVGWGNIPSLGASPRGGEAQRHGEDIQGRPVVVSGPSLGSAPVYLKITAAEATRLCANASS